MCSGFRQVLDFAQVDSWRAQRTGFPEVVYGAGKSAEQIAAIMQQLAKNDQVAMATRIEPQVLACLILDISLVDGDRSCVLVTRHTSSHPLLYRMV